jgi:hypothetical protein
LSGWGLSGHADARPIKSARPALEKREWKKENEKNMKNLQRKNNLQNERNLKSVKKLKSWKSGNNNRLRSPRGGRREAPKEKTSRSANLDRLSARL